MKKIYKLLALSFVITFLSCDDNDDRFQANLDSGWLELTLTSSTTGPTDAIATVPVNVTTPVFNAFEVDYEITAVEGDFTQFISSATGSAAMTPTDGDYGRIFNIELMLENMDEFRDFETVFDVTVTRSSSPNVSVGLADGSKNLTQRITIPCNEPQTLDEILAFDPGFLTGDYTLTDGDIAFILPYFGDESVSQTVKVFVGSTPTERVFQALLFPTDSRFTSTVTITFELVEVPEVGITLEYKSQIDVLLRCSSTQQTPLLDMYTIDTEDEAQADIDYTLLSICGGGPDSYTINYYEDVNNILPDDQTDANACGTSHQFSSFVLTKI